MGLRKFHTCLKFFRRILKYNIHFINKYFTIMSQAQVRPEQVKGLSEAYEKIDALNKNTHGIKIAVWVTAKNNMNEVGYLLDKF